MQVVLIYPAVGKYQSGPLNPATFDYAQANALLIRDLSWHAGIIAFVSISQRNLTTTP